MGGWGLKEVVTLCDPRSSQARQARGVESQRRRTSSDSCRPCAPSLLPALRGSLRHLHREHPLRPTLSMRMRAPVSSTPAPAPRCLFPSPG